MTPSYAELHCISPYTFLRGASFPEELVARAAQLGYYALAITDECSVGGVVRAHVAAKEVGLKLIVGSEFTLDDDLKIVLLAETLEGYGNLCELITLARSRAEKGRYVISRDDLAAGVPACVALWRPSTRPQIEDAFWLRQAFPNAAWIAVELLRVTNDQQYLGQLRELGATVGLKLVAAGDVHMHVRQRQALQDALTAIRIIKPITEAGSALYPNAERHLRSIGRLSRIYPPELLTETLVIADRCNFSLDEIRYQYPKEIVPPGATPAAYLRQLTEEGALIRYPAGVPGKVRTLIEHELTLIAEMRYEPYFLTVYDIVRYAREQGILCQGRGSAANSVVCYCLGVTEVDPERREVLFERFISKERNEPPDIDIDFEHERREEVIQYLYRKYGRDRVAVAGAVHTYRPKGALRDMGKALGFSLDQVDRLAKAISWWDGQVVEEARIVEAGFDPKNQHIQLLLRLVHELLGFPRHLSQHSGGFVIENRKLTRLCPIEPAAMEGRTVLQWDKDDLDALGLLKVDVLALGMLTCIRKSLDLMNACRGTAIRVQDIPSEDPAVYDMLCRADSLGVFQVESRAQMVMLPILRPRTFYDLVVEVAIVRPGPIQGRMVHPYLQRRTGEAPVEYPSKEIESVLSRTLGVAIFQEQVMAIAIVAAGFTPGEADKLRRAMAAWKRKGGVGPFREKLIDGMSAHGYTLAFAEQIYQMIHGFGEYGFPESHAASFALLVYVSAWLKRHEPAAFATALINSQPLGFYSNSQIIQDAQRHQVSILPVDIAVSHWDCTLEKNAEEDPQIRLGFRIVKGLSQTAGERIVATRTGTPFRDVDDLVHRAMLDRHDMTCLAKADALRSLSGHRRKALWQTLGVHQAAPLFTAVKRSEKQPDLFEPTEGEDIIADYAQTDLSLRRHPLALLRARFKKERLMSSAEIRYARQGQLVRIAGIVTCRQRPSTSRGVVFVTLEDEEGFINVVVWKAIAERQRRELLGSRLLVVYGAIDRKDDVVHVLAGRLIDKSHLLGRLAIGSRDFH
jgi:error-prone DNA polymerase